MAFTNLTFLFIFFPVTALIYFLIPVRYKRIKDWVLIIESLIFYAWGDIEAVPVLAASVIFNWLTGRELEFFNSSGNLKMKKITLIEGIIVNIIFLAIFKYTAIGMPVGISFYTFSAISYIADIYMNRHDDLLSFTDGALYMTFFPKLISGPIVKFTDFKRKVRPGFSSTRFFKGGFIFAIGMFKKVLIADQLGAAFAQIQGMESMSVLMSWLGMIFYSFQLYFDFSGYSDMAIGLAKIYGFDFADNFDHPYISKNISEFWRRWHISLGSWFRDYIYIPLGGNRCNMRRQIFNLSVVWVLTGIWHGSGLNFIFWGIYHGIFVILEKFVIKDRLDNAPDLVRILLCDFIVFVGWIFFFSPDLSSAFTWIGRLFGIGATGFAGPASIYMLYSGAVLLIISVLASGTLLQKRGSEFLLTNKKTATKYVGILIFALLLICSVSKMVASTYSSFMYFKF